MSHQPLSAEVDVGQRKGCKCASCIFCQSAIANLAKSPQTHDHPENVLHPCTNFGLVAVPSLEHFVHHTLAAGALASLAVHIDVQFHAKVPLLALAGLVHLGVACFVGVLGGAGCANNGGVHDGVGVDLEATLLQLLANLGKQGLTQFVVIE